jgi:hypothetical protein
MIGDQVSQKLRAALRAQFRDRLVVEPSFRAECPAFLLSREAPGHAVEESLFDVSQTVANRRPNGAICGGRPVRRSNFGIGLFCGERRREQKAESEFSFAFRFLSLPSYC